LYAETMWTVFYKIAGLSTMVAVVQKE